MLGREPDIYTRKITWDKTNILKDLSIENCFVAMETLNLRTVS